MNYRKNLSDLSAGLSLDEEATIASFQSTSLGAYTKTAVGIGIVMNF
jgi:hypothetical protein